MQLDVAMIFGFIAFFWTTCLTDGREFCLTESFHARCRRWNDVILVEHAHFGRMELGRCVTRNFGHIGCSADVISQLDAACSGRPTCDLSVSDPSLVRTKPCPKDFTSYLEVSYKCVPAILPSRDECYEAGKQIITSDFGYVTSFLPRQQTSISSPPSSLTVGSSAVVAHGYTPSISTTSETILQQYDDFTPCPMEFRLQPGQRLNLTLFDFGARNNSNILQYGSTAADYYEEGISKICHRYATIDEPSTGSSATVCGGWTGNILVLRRERHVYTSASNVVRVQLIQSPYLARFMMRFEVIGCADPTWLPPEVHVRLVQLDRLVVFCNHSLDSFVLVCRERRWVGEVKNCTPSVPIAASRPATAPSSDVSPAERSYTDVLGLPHIGMSVVIILGVAMVTVVYVAVVMVCVLHIRRWRKKSPVSTSTSRSMKFDAMPSSPPPSCNLSPCLTHNERTPIAHVCEKLVSGGQSRDHRQLYSEFFELHPRPMQHTSRCVIEPTYQSSRPISVRHVPDRRPIGYVRSVETGSKCSFDGVGCNEDSADELNSPSSSRCRCSGTTGRPWSSGDGMTSFFGGFDAIVTSSASVGGAPAQPLSASQTLTSPDVVPDSDGPTANERIEST